VELSQGHSAGKCWSWDLTHVINQSLPFHFWVISHLKDPSVWQRVSLQFNRPEWKWKDFGYIFCLCVGSDPTWRNTEVQSGSWQLSRADTAPAFGLEQQQVRFVYDCIVTVCGLMPTSDGNLVSPVTCVSFL
jgi:hypothetical protein